MSGSRYTIEIEVKTQQGVKGVKQLEEGLGKLSVQVNKMNKGSKEADKGLQKLDQTAKGHALLELADRVDNIGEKFANFGANILSMSADMTQGIIRDTATFEDAESSMRFAFGKNWENMFDKVKKEAADLTFLFSETLDLAASMGRIDVNPFGTAGEDLEIFKGKTGAMISAFQVLQDSADATGRNAGAIALAVKNALGGQFKMLKNAADVGPELFKTWKDDINAAGTQQEKYNVLIQKLATQFGGAGALRSNNFNKVMAQLPDLVEILRASIGKLGLKKITAALKDFVEAFTELTKNEVVVKALSDTFLLLAKGIAFVIKSGAKFLRWITGVVEAAPALPGIAVGITLISAAVSLLLGLTLMLGAAIMMVVGGLMIVGAKAVAAIIVALPLFMMLGVWIGIIVGVLGAFAAALFSTAGAAKQNVSIWEKLKSIWTALVEIIETFSNGQATLSKATADGLRRTGMYEFAQKIVGIINNLSAFWAGLKEGWSVLLSDVGPAMNEMLLAIKDAIMAIAEAFGFTDAATSGTQSWREAALSLVRVLAQIIIVIANIITVAANFISMLSNLGVLNGIIYALIAVFIALGAVMAIVAVMAFISFLPIIMILVAIGLAVYVVYKGVMLLVDGLMAVGEALGLVDEKASKATSSTDGLTQSLQGAADVQFPGGAGAMHSVNRQAPAAVGATGAAPGAQPGLPSIPGMPKGMQMPGMPSGMAQQYGAVPGQGLVPPSHVLPPTVQGGSPNNQGMQEVVSAVNGVKTAVSSLGASIRAQKSVVNVMIDGQRVAEIIKSYDDGVNGGNN